MLVILKCWLYFSKSIPEYHVISELFCIILIVFLTILTDFSRKSLIIRGLLFADGHVKAIQIFINFEWIWNGATCYDFIPHVEWVVSSFITIPSSIFKSNAHTMKNLSLSFPKLPQP